MVSALLLSIILASCVLQESTFVECFSIRNINNAVNSDKSNQNEISALENAAVTKTESLREYENNSGDTEKNLKLLKIKAILPDECYTGYGRAPDGSCQPEV